MLDDINITWPPTKDRKTEKTASLNDIKIIIGYHRSDNQIRAIFADMPGETTKEPDFGHVTLKVLKDFRLALASTSTVDVEPVERCSQMVLLFEDFWNSHGKAEYMNPQGKNYFVIKADGEIISQA
jgi:hypothetical protein